jgi:hypothetical protein
MSSFETCMCWRTAGGVLALAVLWTVLAGCARPNSDVEDAADTSSGAADDPNRGAESTSKARGSNAAGATVPGAAAGEDAQRADQFGRLPPPDEEQFPGLRPLSPEYDVWIDADRKRVVLRGGVCLREGPLELFACIHRWVEDEFAEGGKVRRGTKEYESVVTVNTTAAHVHTALLAVGAEPGGPVRFTPEYEPASGTRIDVLLSWEDADGKRQESKAQEWIQSVQTGESMEHSWVFAGSGFRVNEATGERRYLGEAGNLICVSNFPDAVMDIPVQSSAANAALLFEAFTERIPPVGTPVTILLVPQLGEP